MEWVVVVGTAVFVMWLRARRRRQERLHQGAEFYRGPVWSERRRVKARWWL